MLAETLISAFVVFKDVQCDARGTEVYPRIYVCLRVCTCVCPGVVLHLCICAACGIVHVLTDWRSACDPPGAHVSHPSDVDGFVFSILLSL